MSTRRYFHWWNFSQKIVNHNGSSINLESVNSYQLFSYQFTVYRSLKKLANPDE